MTTAPSLDKTAFLQAMAPLFPDVSGMEARLRELENDPPTEENWQVKHFQVAETIYAPLWQALAPAYVAALAHPFGSDQGTLGAARVDWPDTIEQQQQRLEDLLAKSQMGQAWRDYAATFAGNSQVNADHSQRENAELLFEQSKAPMREIPLYQGMMRVSCQQVICMPVATWQSMFDPSKVYEPQTIDRNTVDRLATRVARVFNTPPMVDLSLLRDSTSWDDPVVWSANASTLTNPTNSHGMRDRWKTESWLEEIRKPPEDIVAPHWRYEGFCGQILVTLESGEDWYVTILAPMHFVRRLAYYGEWFRREKSS